jgi:hypothetical protein
MVIETATDEIIGEGGKRRRRGEVEKRRDTTHVSMYINNSINSCKG